MFTDEKGNSTFEAEAGEAKLKQKGHWYKALYGDFATDENGRIKKFISASGLGSGLFSNIDASTKASIDKYGQMLDEGKAINAPVDLAKWQRNGFGNTGDLAFNLMSSSLLGQMQHAANEGIIKAIQGSNGALTLSGIISGEQSVDLTDILKPYKDQLQNLLGGNAELTDAFMNSQGGILANAIKVLEELKAQKVKENASNVSVERELAGTISFGKNKEFSQNIAATLDNIRYDEENAIISSIDLKRKAIAGKMSPADIVEGFVQQYLVGLQLNNSDIDKAKEFARSLGVGEDILNNDQRFEELRRNSAQASTQFVKIGNNQTSLIEAGILGEGDFADPNKMLALLLMYYVNNIQNGGGGPKLNEGDLPSFELRPNGMPEVFTRDEKDEALKNRVSLEKELTNLQYQKHSLQTGPYLGSTDTEQAVIALNERELLIKQRIADAQADINKLKEQGKLSEEEEAELMDALNAEETNRITRLARDRSGGGYSQRGLGMTLMDVSKQLLGNTIGFGAATVAINKMVQAFKQAIRYAAELDKKLVDLQIATGNTKTETYAMLKEYNQLAKEMGRSTTSVADAANDWLRAGYEGKEAAELIKSSMYLSTLGMMDAATATRDLISVLKGWKLQSSEVMGVVDKLVSVDMQAAVNH